jgi:hypothetical protein
MAQEDFTIEVCLKTTSSSDIFSKTDGDENYESGEKHFILTNGIPVFAAWGNGTIKGSTAVMMASGIISPLFGITILEPMAPAKYM